MYLFVTYNSDYRYSLHTFAFFKAYDVLRETSHAAKGGNNLSPIE